MRQILLNSIRIYQKYISPYKGFSCSYREHTGHAGCSALGYRAVRRYGVFSGLALIQQRTHLCGVVHRRQHDPLRRPLHSQRGVCDIGCDLPCDASCDFPNTSSFFKFFNFFSCGDCASCDRPQRKNKNYAEEKYVYIPPKVKNHS